MKAISPKQQGQLSDLVAELDDRAEQLRDKITAFNDASALARQDLETAAGEYDTAATALREFLDELGTAAESYVDSRSDRWRESDTGAAYAEWAQNLAAASSTVPEIDPSWFEIEELSEPELFDADSWVYPANAPAA